MTEKKRRRQESLVLAVRKEPFLTDEALARRLSVSVQTVRLDRTELGIPELRARVRTRAENAREKVRAIPHAEVVGRTITSLPTRRSRAGRRSFHRQTHWHLRLSMRRSRSRGSRTSNIKPPSTRGIRSSRRRRS